MRIALDCRMKHGVATVVKNIVPYIASHMDPPHLLGDPRQFHAWWPSGIPGTVVEFLAPVYGMREQIEFPLTEIRDCQLLHVPHFNVPLRKLPFPLLVTINDTAHLAGVLPIRWAYLQAARLYYAHAVMRADHIITLSEFSKQEIISRLNVKSENISVIPCGVDTQKFRPMGQDHVHDVAARLNIRLPYLLISGSVRPHKNIGRVLEAFSELKKRYRIPHQLVIVGEREGFRINESLPKLTDEVEKDVRFTGYIEESDLITLFSGTEVFIFASLYEGFGLPPLEAMACGAPVAASRAASIPEVVGEAGVYFDPRSVYEMVEAVHRLIANPVERKKHAEASVARAKLFNWSVSAHRYVEVYKRFGARQKTNA